MSVYVCSRIFLSCWVKGEIKLTSLLWRPNELLYYMWGDVGHIVAQIYTKWLLETSWVTKIILQFLSIFSPYMAKMFQQLIIICLIFSTRFFHIWLISGDHATMIFFLVVFHIFSIYDKYLENVQIRIKHIFFWLGRCQEILKYGFNLAI